MPKAEVGSTKYLSNKLKSKGLQRLRWYCQVCSRQMRDENGFKMHVQSESHVRQMLVVGEDPKKAINEFSEQFKKDFLQLLRTGHGTKSVQINHFYQEYIANKEHVHMNATRWPSLTEFAKYLGREGICRVEETDKGIHIAWIDNSPEALKRHEALRRKEMQDRGNEELEQKMIREQIKRAEQAARARGDTEKDEEEDRGLQRQEGEKIKLSFGAKAAPKEDPSATASPAEGQQSPKKSPSAEVAISGATDGLPNTDSALEQAKASEKEAEAKPLALKFGAKPQPKNVFAQAKKGNAFSSGAKKSAKIEQPKKMSEAERIMREEMERQERKRQREGSGFGGPNKKQRQ
ncbi:putative zinc finger protein rts2 protein [Phaeoacremonium minimum UCRPA7]|uniref:Putative zinc finger protein rts2 protein n=1 Tax=Phaeoacremonium minimum (strain UCR-PA7) TaxID=1286976 RepID=R8B9W9_PHAM7|nr:putative zinc finger protein rts2 protein [Phaeoacremonium minimum UCRPA7]EON96110.1 putative zinc finger protein rts2 protein [Phaeoacremonium minimum UCRPA7]